MSRILVAADAVWIRDLVKTAFVAPGQEILEASRGQDVRDIVGAESPDLVILDSQIGNMGGVATSIDLRLEAAAGRVPDVSILLLLDREADRFLARRASADGVLVKPVDAGRLRRAARQILDDSSAPVPAGTEG